MSKLTDFSRMPFGKYINEQMTNVPASYLLWLYDNNKCSGNVKTYIEENLEVLKEEIKADKK
jgi:uncharacterized protein (DUF3820 family)